MPRRAGNVIPLRRARPTSTEELPVPVERLGAAVRRLDDLRTWVERVRLDPRWSAREWRAACMPLAMRLPTAQQSLAELAGIRAGRWPDTDWAVRLRSARDEVEQRLQVVSMSMGSLLEGDAFSVGAVVDFSSDGAKLVEAIDDLCDLIAGRYPEAVKDV